ncbi:MAG: AMP-binding protein [Cellvibrionaceae bacterium]
MNKVIGADMVGLLAVNSLDFLHKAFELYRDKRTFALIKKAGGEISLASVITPESGGGWFSLKQQPLESDEPAQIVFTSGTTGASKAIVLSHRNLADVVERLNAVMQVEDSIREYVGVPVTYSFGLGRCRAVAAVGGQCFIPEHGFSPEQVASMMDAGEINAISAVPSQWRLVLANRSRFAKSGSRIKWIEIGSQTMSGEEKEKLRRLFPEARIVQHYGLTEASRSTFLKVHEATTAELESVGEASGGVELRISPQGVVEVRGRHVTPGRLVDGEIVPLTDAEGWLSTGDKGRIENGLLYYEGRVDDIINCGGVKISPEAFQQQIFDRLSAKGVSSDGASSTGTSSNGALSNGDVAVARYRDPLRGEGLLVAREAGSPIAAKALEQAVLEASRLYDGNIESTLRFITVDLLPRTDTGKIKRGELTEMAEREAPRPIGGSGDLLDVFRQTFKLQNVTEQSTFESLHGDSINHVELSIAVEQKLGREPSGWEAMSIAELQSLAADKPKGAGGLSRLDMSMWLRVVAILAVVATHAGLGIVGGGTLLLAVLIGYNLARFKFNGLVRENSFRTLVPYVGKMLIPYYMLAALYFVWGGAIEWDVLFLYANLVDLKLTVVFPFWFVQVLMQSFVIVACVLSIPWLCTKLVENPWRSSYLLLLCFFTVRLGYPLLWDTTPLNDLVPLRFVGILWVGWTAYFARSGPQQALTALAAIAFALADFGLQRQVLWMSVGVPVLLYVADISLPAIVRVVSLRIAAATFYIFIFNGLFIYVFQKLFGIDNILIGTLVGLLGSMAIWWVVEERGLLYWGLSKVRQRQITVNSE